MKALLARDVAISGANKSRIAATLAAERRLGTLALMLDHMSIAEVLSFGKFLDAPRKVRQLRRRFQALEAGNQRVLRATKTAMRHKIAAAESEVLDGGNVSGALARKIRAKVRASIPAEKLEFYLLAYPTTVWKDLADIVHFKPSDFALDHFLPCVYGAPAPEGSLVADARALGDTAEAASALGALLVKHPNLLLDYSYIRTRFSSKKPGCVPLPDAVKMQLARGAPLEDVLWFYDELDAPGAEDAVEARLSSGESLDAGRGRTNFGKLMERLILFRSRRLKFVPALMKYAESKLLALKAESAPVAAAKIEGGGQKEAAASSSRATGGRVAVLGDASGSMEVAINTATILGSLLSVCLDADLRFFNDRAFAPELMPSTAGEVMKVTEQVAAEGITAPAAALASFFAEPPVDLFIIVSDEEENTPDASTGKSFAELFAQYRREKNPHAAVFLVSFLSGPSSFLGKMNASLRRAGIACRQFRLSARQPDLSKLSGLLALLKLELDPSLAMDEAVAEVEAAVARVPPPAPAAAVPTGIHRAEGFVGGAALLPPPAPAAAPAAAELAGPPAAPAPAAPEVEVAVKVSEPAQ